jgi:hypothetical protein
MEILFTFSFVERAPHNIFTGKPEKENGSVNTIGKVTVRFHCISSLCSYRDDHLVSSYNKSPKSGIWWYKV